MIPDKTNEWWSQSFLDATGLSIGLAIVVGIVILFLLRGK